MKKNKILSLSLLASFASLTAAEARTFNNIIRPFQSARSSSMGGVRYSTGLYEENFFANPARMADSEKWRIDIINMMIELNSGSIKNVNKLAKSGDVISNLAETAGTNNHVRIQTIIPAYYSPRFIVNRNSFAVGLIQSTQADIGLRRSMSLEPNVFMDIGPAVTFARKFAVEDRVAVGITAHYMYRVATKDDFSTVDYIRGTGFKSVSDGAGEGTKIDFDLGARHNINWEPKGWELQSALAVNNVMGSKYKQGLDLISGTQPEPMKLPRSINAGLSARKSSIWGLGMTTLAFEVQDIGNNEGGSLFRLLHMGGEIALKDTIFLRAGINQGYACLGVGFDLPVLKLDFSTYGEEMSLNAGGQEDRRYAMRLGFSL